MVTIKGKGISPQCLPGHKKQSAKASTEMPLLNQDNDVFGEKIASLSKVGCLVSVITYYEY